MRAQISCPRFQPRGGWRPVALFLLAGGVLALVAPPVGAQLITVSASATTLDESTGSVSITFTASGATPRSRPLNVSYRVTGPAGDTIDIRLVGPSFVDHTGPQTISIGPTQRERSIAFRGTRDTFVEGPETFTVTLESITQNATAPGIGSFAIGSQRDVTVTVNDDDIGVVSIERDPMDTVFREGGMSAAAEASFTIGIDPSVCPIADVMVPYTLSGIDVDDITATSTTGTAVIAVGSQAATITLRAVDDALNEGTETMTVTLGTPITTLGTVRLDSDPAMQSAEALLADNDPTTIDFDVQTRTGSEGIAFRLRFDFRGGELLNNVDVTYEIRGTAVTPADFDGLPGASDPDPSQQNPPPIRRTITFTPAQIRAAPANRSDRDLQTEDDTLSEADEVATVEIVSISLVQGGRGVLQLDPTVAAVALTIADNDPVFLRVTDAVTTEGGVLDFTIAASGLTFSAVTGRYRTVAGTAGVADYTSTSSAGTPFRIPAGMNQVTTFSVQTTDDSDVEDDTETFGIELSGLSGGGPRGARPDPMRGRGTGTIRENDLGLSLQRTTPPGAVEEGDIVAFTLTRRGTRTPAVTVQYNVTMGGMTQNVPVQIPSGASSAPFSVTVMDDDTAEDGETVRVELQGVTPPLTDQSPVVAFPEPRNAQIDVAGSDRTDVVLERLTGSGPNPSVVPGGGTVAEGDGMATYRVMLSGDMPNANRPVEVTWRVEAPAGGGRAADAADFGGALPVSAGGTPLRFTAVGVPQEFAVPVAQDGEVEGDESFAVTAMTSAPNTVVMSATVTTTLLDDDVGVAVRAEQSVVPEGGTATLTFTRSGRLDVPASVMYSVRGVDPADFRDPLGGRIVLPANAPSASLELAILGDGVEEDDETLEVAVDAVDIPAPGVGVASAQIAAVTIPRLEIEIALSGQELVQEGDVARFAVVLSLVPAGTRTFSDVVLAYDLGEGGDSAIRGDDYEPPPDARDGAGELRIPTGELAGTIEVPVRRDGVLEAEEIFSLALVPGRSSGGGGTLRVAAGQQRLRVRILDDADQEARREQRTRGMLAVTHRAAAQLAGDVITTRLGRAQRAERSHKAGREGAPDTSTGCAPHSCHPADANTGQKPPPSAHPPMRSIATGAMGAALRLVAGSEQLSPTSGEANPAAPLPPGAAHGGSDVPFRPFETGLPEPDYDAESGAGGGGGGLRLPRLAELLGRVDFELRGDEIGWDRQGEGLAVWGVGAFTSLEGDPVLGRQRLDYEGESYGLFLGADQRLELGAAGAGRELLVGAALGWTRGDLDYRDRVGFELEGRFESELLSIHPYVSLQLSPRTRLWLLAGYGWGDVDIEEREGPRLRRRVETDATMWMVSAGAEGSLPLPGFGEATELLVRLSGTRTSGSLDRARFDDGALLRGTRARTWRVAGELEGSHRIAFSEGGSFRPFVTTRLRGDAGDDLGDDWEFSVDVGGGAELAWPERGLTLGLRGTAQLNEGAGHREHRVVVDLTYDSAGDGRGLTVAVKSALEGSAQLAARRRDLASVAPAAGGDLGGLGGGSLGALLPGRGDPDTTLDPRVESMRPSLQGEIGYGFTAQPFRRRGLLTPYARLGLAAGGRSYALGLRFESPADVRLGIEAGGNLDRGGAATSSNATPSPDYQFLLLGELHF